MQEHFRHICTHIAARRAEIVTRGRMWHNVLFNGIGRLQQRVRIYRNILKQHLHPYKMRIRREYALTCDELRALMHDLRMRHRAAVVILVFLGVFFGVAFKLIAWQTIVIGVRDGEMIRGVGTTVDLNAVSQRATIKQVRE